MYLFDRINSMQVGARHRESKISADNYTYLGEPAPDISKASVFGSPFSGIKRASPKSKIFTDNMKSEIQD